MKLRVLSTIVVLKIAVQMQQIFSRENILEENEKKIWRNKIMTYFCNPENNRAVLNKENNKIILKNAKPFEGKKNTWLDNNYLYIEWDTENPYSKEMWYKVLIYSKK